MKKIYLNAVFKRHMGEFKNNKAKRDIGVENCI